MKNLTKISLIASFMVVANAQTINLERGWNNIGVINDTPITDFNQSNIKYIWQYSHGRWNVYTPNNTVMDRIRRDVESGNVNYGVINGSVLEGSALWIYSNVSTQIRVGEIGYTVVHGVVKDSLTNELIRSFTVRLDDRNITFSNGEFSLNNVPLGDHNVTIFADGYIPLNMNLILDSTEPKNIGQIYLVPETANHEINLSGKIRDAVTGNNIEGARIQFFPGYNNVEGSPIVDEIVTGGQYNVTIPAGSYTIRIEATGYYSTTYNYTFSPENNETLVNQDFTIVPKQTNTNYPMRAVLTWGKTPTDLDSHLIAYDNNSIKWHVYYGNQEFYNNDGNIVVNLDVDDTDSFGPETITLRELNSSLNYTYFVHRYSDDDELKNSNAHVRVLFNGREYDFDVPNEDGITWKVFDIKNGVLIPCVSGCMYNSYNELINNGYDNDLPEYEINDSIEDNRTSGRINNTNFLIKEIEDSSKHSKK